MSNSNIMTMDEYKSFMQKQVKKKVGHPEHDQQVKVFQWASIMSHKHPELELLMAIPNGAFYGGHWSVAMKMKAEGVKSGVPDIFLPVGRCDDDNEYGLWIEMKVGKNKPTEEQKWWLYELMAQGYRTRVCYSAEEAIEEISKYLNLKDK